MKTRTDFSDCAGITCKILTLAIEMGFRKSDAIAHDGGRQCGSTQGAKVNDRARTDGS